MKKLITILLISLISFFASAQSISDYTFASVTGTYTEITGGTQLGSGAGLDDGNYNANNIGFTFNYGGTNYTQFSLNCNGFIAMGATVISSYYALSTGTTNNVIAAFNADLQGNTGATLRYELSGTSPNRILTIQWKDFRHYAASSESYNFQIKLFETTNAIKIVYGTIVKNTTNRTKQVGLRGSSNAVFNNRKTPTTCDWTATLPGTANTDNCTLTSSCYPPSGLTFTFAPGIANPGGPFTATPISTTQINLTFTTNPSNDNVLILWSPSNSFTAPSGAPPAVGQPFAGGFVLYLGKTSPVPHTGLTPVTLYWYKAFSYTGTAYSNGVTQSATTFCNDATIPFSESFDGTTFPPTCWITAKTAGTGTGLWDRQTAPTCPTATPHSGAGLTRYYSCIYSAGTKGILTSANFSLPSPSENYSVKFWMYRDDGYPTAHDLVNIYINNQQNLTGATILGTIERYRGFPPIVAANGWYEYTFSFPSGKDGSGRFVIFEGVSQYGANIYIDDFEVFAPPGSLDGYVKDYNGNPISGATVQRVGGVSTTSDGVGYYLLTPVPSGPQQIEASKISYHSVTATINIPPGGSISHNFILTQPTMSVTPGSFYEVLFPTESTTTNLVISNDGNGPLGWNTQVNLQAVASVLAYCPADGTTLDEYISRFVLNTIDNSSGWTGYSDYTNISTSVLIGSTYNMYVTIGTPYSLDHVSAWIDWNQDGQFNESAVIFTGIQSSPMTGTFTVPTGALTGSTRLRVRLHYDTTPNPCGSEPYGEVEDYTVNVSDPRWLTMDDYSGSVPPFGGKDTLPVHIYASKAEGGSNGIPGHTYNGQIHFTSNPDVGTIDIPVTLKIADINLPGPTELKVVPYNVPQNEILLTWDFTGRTVMDFIVTRNSVVIATTKEYSYIDTLPGGGDYCYKVIADYGSDGAAEYAGPQCIHWLDQRVPLSNWALLLGVLLIAGYAVFMIRRRM